MLTVYVLSYSHKVVVDNEPLEVYQWKRVGKDQVSFGMDFLPTLPDLTEGSTVSFKVADNREQILKVLGNGQLRQLSKKEKRNLKKTNAPIVRIG